MTNPEHPPRKDAPGAAPSRGRKRPYAKPRVTDYGSVTKLTQGTRTRQSDSPTAGFKMTCL